MIENIKYILLFIIPGILSLAVSSQEDPLLRVEIETNSDAATYKIAACGDKGAMMFYKTTIEQDNYKFWIFVFYNKFMHEAWKKDIPIYKNMAFAKQKLRGNFLYILFHDADKKKSEHYNYQILKVNISEGSYELFSGDVPDKASFEAFDEYGDYIIAGMNVEEDESGIYGLNIESNETKPIFEIKTNRSEFENIYVDTLKNSYIAIFNVYESKDIFYLLLKEFDKDGKNINTIKLIPEKGKKFNTAKIITVNENERFAVGTYDIIKGNSIDKKNYFGDESSGFYTINIKSNEPQPTRFFNFLELENMTGYLKSKEYQQARKKAGKKEDEGDKYSIDFDLLLHDIIYKNNKFYFIAEAYYEEYHTVTNTYFDYYGRPVPVSYSVFDGYKYFNAFITCYDKEGKKLWDNGMEIFNILSFDLKNRVNIYFVSDEIVMAYNREGKIASKIIKGPDVVEGVEYSLLESTYVNDKIKTDSKSNMVYWYDKYFIAYGFQTIKNNSLLDNSKRLVFYINKVAFQ